MEAFTAMGNTFRSIAEENKIWRLPLILAGASTAIFSILGINDYAELVGYTPKITMHVAIPLALIALLLRIPTFYYPTKAYKHRFNGEDINEGRLLRESLIGGLKVILVSIVYGFLASFVALLLLIPAILLYLILPKPIGYVVAAIPGIPAVLFILGLIAMMVPAYIWTEDFSAGMDIIGTAWGEKKETIFYGLLLAISVVGIVAAVGGIVLLLSWTAKGILTVFFLGLIDGALTEIANVISSVSGAEMFVRLTGRPTWEKRDEIRVDPDWLASL